MKKVLSILFAAAVIQGCAFTPAELQVAHNEDANIVGPISEVKPMIFAAPVIEDNRTDKERIGWKKNGYGQHTADITTTTPVNGIVSAAISDALQDNGHALEDNGKYIITGTVDTFWFESDVNFWTVDFSGDLQCTFTVTDSATNEVIYTSPYSGTFKKSVGGGLEKTWTEVMNQAVDNLVEDFVFDEELAEALEAHSAS